MTMQEFEEAYCHRRVMSLYQYRQVFVSLPCACGRDTCEGWTAVDASEAAILKHLAINLPENKKLKDMAERTPC